jgi:AcrR family transcriptional regulator
MLNAAALEIVERGYAASSLASIASRIGLTKGALVRRFPAKEDIAWGIIDTLRSIISAEYSRSLDVYPQSGIRSLIRFLLAVGSRAAREPQVAAAVVLFTDRASPGFEVTQVLDDWTQAIHRFLHVARGFGEVDPETDLQELAEYIFITNIGQAVFGTRAHVPERTTPRLRFMRITLRNAGVTHVDALVDEVLESNGAGSIERIPPRSGVNRDQ